MSIFLSVLIIDIPHPELSEEKENWYHDNIVAKNNGAKDGPTYSLKSELNIHDEL